MRHLYWIVAITVFALDRLTKIIIEAWLPPYQSRTVIPHFFDLTHTRNTGVAFGIFANTESPWVPHFLTLISFVALIIILVFYYRHSPGNWKLQVGLMLVLGGAIGNLYDRIQYGYVIDFIDLYYKSYHWPTFNLADSSISIGIGLLLLEILVQRPRLVETQKRGAKA